jgi:predicted  nucleic acid-binding Zn-ribbon protein
MKQGARMHYNLREYYEGLIRNLKEIYEIQTKWIENQSKRIKQLEDMVDSMANDWDEVSEKLEKTELELKRKTEECENLREKMNENYYSG